MTGRHDQAARRWGSGDLDAVFGGHDRVVAPWPRAPRRKGQPAFDRAVLAQLEAFPPALVEADPRDMWSSQPWVLRHHVAYYLTGQWERTGVTSADQFMELNRFPVVVTDHRDRMVIASGHHRATAALVEGRPLLVRRIATGPACAVTPLLWWDPTVEPIDASAAVESVVAGLRRPVPSLDIAADVLGRLDVSTDAAQHRVGILARQADRWRARQTGTDPGRRPS